MPWWQFALLGASGGAIVEVLAVFRSAIAWQHARRNGDGTIKLIAPGLQRYIDIPAHAAMLPARVVLGAAAAVLCGVTGQVTGPYGAVAIGCAAPVLLAQLGSIPQVARAINGASEVQKGAMTQHAAIGNEAPADTAVAAGEGSLP
jgi:hypothetical protein